MKTHTEEQAKARGYTQRMTWDSGDGLGGDILVKPGTDLDGDFPAFCCEENEMLTMHGWAIFIEECVA